MPSPALPTEIIVEIFSNLDYMTLKCSVRRVCRRFRFIVDSAKPKRGRLAVALFRDEFVKLRWDQKAAPVELHPCFSSLRVRAGSDPEYVGYSDIPIGLENYGFVSPSTGAFTPLQDTVMADENAFSPSWDRVMFYMRPVGVDMLGSGMLTSAAQEDPEGVIVRKGITVMELLSAVDQQSLVDKEPDPANLSEVLFRKGGPIFPQHGICLRRPGGRSNYKSVRRVMLSLESK